MADPATVTLAVTATAVAVTLITGWRAATTRYKPAYCTTCGHHPAGHIGCNGLDGCAHGVCSPTGRCTCPAYTPPPE